MRSKDVLEKTRSVSLSVQLKKRKTSRMFPVLTVPNEEGLQCFLTKMVSTTKSNWTNKVGYVLT